MLVSKLLVDDPVETAHRSGKDGAYKHVYSIAQLASDETYAA